MTRHRQPLLTIGLITYNAEKHIRVALESLRQQSFDDFELVVVDGGSVDGTLDVLTEYKECWEMRLVSEKDDGSNHAFGKAIDYAKGRYFLLLCADDWLEPGALDDIPRTLAQNPDVVTITNHFWSESAGIFRTFSGSEARLCVTNLLAGRLLTNARIVRLALLKPLLPVRHRIPHPHGRLTLASDMDLWLRLRPNVLSQTQLHQAAVTNRWHDGSLTFNHNKTVQRQLTRDALWFIRDAWRTQWRQLSCRQHIAFAFYTAKRLGRLIISATPSLSKLLKGRSRP